MRATGGGGEVPVPAYELFSDSEFLGRMALGKMLGGLLSRRYRVGLEPVGEKVERAASATSKSAVSRRFVATSSCGSTVDVGLEDGSDVGVLTGAVSASSAPGQ